MRYNKAPKISINELSKRQQTIKSIHKNYVDRRTFAISKTGYSESYVYIYKLETYSPYINDQSPFNINKEQQSPNPVFPNPL